MGGFGLLGCSLQPAEGIAFACDRVLIAPAEMVPVSVMVTFAQYNVIRVTDSHN